MGWFEFVVKAFKFLNENPWIWEFIKKLFDKSAAQKGLTLADVEQEVQQLRTQQLQVPPSP